MTQGRRNGRRRGALAALWILAAGCATEFPGGKPVVPKVDPAAAAEERGEDYRRVMSRYRERMLRLEEVGDRLAVAAAPLCGERVVPNLGLVALSLSDFDYWTDRAESHAQIADAAERFLGVGERVRVIGTVAGMPAARAGLRDGDDIAAVNGTPVAKWSEVSVALEQRRTEPVTISVVRSTAPLEIPYERACDVPIDLELDMGFDAYADREVVHVSLGLLHAVASDDELAIILGHEMAHVILKHRFGSEQGIERQADYVGLYLAARAGYDVSQGPALWRRWAEDTPTLVHDYRYSHDGIPERIVLIEATIREIDSKRSNGQPLLPALVAEPDAH